MRARGRRPLVAGNWKMHHDHFQAIAMVQRLVLRLGEQATRDAEVCVLPSFTSLRSLQVLLDGDESPVVLGAQTCAAQDEGAFTGEVSARMLAKLDVRYVLAGHSERRRLNGETDAVVAAKLAAILRNRMSPILCVGETEEERAAGRTLGRLEEQLTGALAETPSADVVRTVVAYEPIWAIGTGLAARGVDAQEAAETIRSQVRSLHGDEAGSSLRVLYGGSVTETNAAELMAGSDVDGVLVGGASLDADGFAAIADAAPRGR